MRPTTGLSVADYVVIAVMLLIPLGIGILFAYIDRNRSNREEYLLGGRRMSLLPITLSLFVTFQSAISLMGLPNEVYSFGGMFPLTYIGYSLSYIVGFFIMIPVMYPLKLTSLYEYLYLRYQSQTVRLLSTLIGMLQTVFYMAVALFSPALALQTTTSMPLWTSVVLVGMIGTVYTAIGGMKSVVWTDTFQTLIVFLGIFMIFIKGCIAVGGLNETFSIAQEGGRLTFTVISPDPRTRHSLWGMLGGGMVTWLVNVFNQSTLQRIASMKSERDAKVCFLLNMPLLISYAFFLLCVGVAMYAYFSVLGCDPIKGGIVTDGNQMTPFFVMHVLHDLPGMPGLFMSTLFSGSLSTISSGLNSLAANTVEDILRRPLQSVKESTVTWFIKAIVFLYGAIIIGLAYGAKSFQGPVTQMSTSVFGACGSPVFGMFLMGVTVPWANKYGAVTGATVSLVFNLFLAISGQLYGKKSTRLPTFSTDNCSSFVDSNNVTFFGGQTSFGNILTNMTTSSMYPDNSVTNTNPLPTDRSPYDNSFFLFDISYEWYGFIGTFVCVSVGLIVSYLTRGLVKTTPDPSLLTPFCRRWCPESKPSDIPLKLMNSGNKDKVAVIKVIQKNEKEKNTKS